MNVDRKTVFRAVEESRDEMKNALRFLWKHPETGYRERESSAYLCERFRKVGYETEEAGNVPGFTATLDTGRKGPEILVLCELDALLCPDHPAANKKTGAVHACGHHAQCAALIGVAAACRKDEIRKTLSGRIRFCAVPAEELIELDFRSSLRKKKIIRHFCGKREFLARGLFDGVDLALTAHASTAFSVTAGMVGCTVKEATFRGVAAHAGGAPHLGKNALYAATCGINAVNALRETFREEDLIRVHPILSHGGDSVNAIPDRVRLESYVRGKTQRAIEKANDAVNRALIGGALSLGAEIDVADFCGYYPLLSDETLLAAAKEAAALVLPDENFIATDAFGSGSSDMGDLSAIMPVLHPFFGGARGTVHGNDYEIYDFERACVKNAAWQTALLCLLLEDGAARAKDCLSRFQPAFPDKDAFLSFIEKEDRSAPRLRYLSRRAEALL